MAAGQTIEARLQTIPVVCLKLSEDLDTNYMELNPFLRSLQLCSYSRTSQNFMETQVSLSYSQGFSTGH
jgi:hypothetical protein